jgi:hypothetical protein
VGKNYPVGADFDTWSWLTHQADEIIFVSQALDLQTVKIAAYSRVIVGAGPALGGPLIIVDAAPP